MPTQILTPPQGITDRALTGVGQFPRILFTPPQGLGTSQLLASMAYPVEASPLIQMAYPIVWLDLQFLQRIPLTINGGQVISTQTDFPLLISGTFSDLEGAVADEIRFAGKDNVQLDYEIEFFNPLDGTLIAWAKKPLVNDGDIIYIYFDNSSVSDEQNATAVWSDYNAVYHLNQIPTGIAGDILDSTANNEDGTTQNMDAVNQVAGQIDGSLTFDAVDEFILMSNNTILDPVTGGWTVSAWVKPDSDGRMNILGKQIFGDSFDGWSFRISEMGNDRKLFVLMKSTTGNLRVSGNIQLTVSTLHHVAFTYDGSGDASGISIFVDGVKDVINIDADDFITGISTDSEFNIGDLGDITPSGLLWEGIIDEVNISNIEKTPDFIATSFNNQSNPSLFYSTGPVESVPTLTIMGYPA